MSRTATLQELETSWSFEDIMKANDLLDMKLALEKQRHDSKGTPN